MRDDLERSGVHPDGENNEILVDLTSGTGGLQPRIRALAAIIDAGERQAP